MSPPVRGPRKTRRLVKSMFVVAALNLRLENWQLWNPGNGRGTVRQGLVDPRF